MTAIVHYGRNVNGKDYIIGDIHGCFSKVEAILTQINFNPEVDRLFSVGDLIDRGPESERVVEWLDKPWFHPVMGNHEDFTRHGEDSGMMMTWMRNGGMWFLGLPKAQQAEIVARIAELPIAIELETANGLVGIIHADVPKKSWTLLPETLKRQHAEEYCMWSRGRIYGNDAEPVDGVFAVVVGHTPLSKVVTLGNVIHIDTAGWQEDGKFTILDASTLQAVF